MRISWSPFRKNKKTVLFCITFFVLVQPIYLFRLSFVSKDDHSGVPLVTLKIVTQSGEIKHEHRYKGADLIVVIFLCHYIIVAAKTFLGFNFKHHITLTAAHGQCSALMNINYMVISFINLVFAKGLIIRPTRHFFLPCVYYLTCNWQNLLEFSVLNAFNFNLFCLLTILICASLIESYQDGTRVSRIKLWACYLW